jgi:formate dehydrogenase major subunit
MKVHTHTDNLRKLRRGVMELYISDHPLDCLTCSANGNCELQDTAGEVGLREVRYGYEGENHLSRGSMDPTHTSISIRRNASFARAACAPARKCRAHSR